MRPLTDLVVRHTEALDRCGPYAPPDARLVAALPALLDDVAAARDVRVPAEAMGLRRTVAGGWTVLHPPEPGGPPWVVVAVPAAGPSVGPSVVVEVPHPAADLDTELVALEMLARMPSALLLMAGAHRVASGPFEAGVRERAAYPADVAVRPDALFSRVAEGLVARTGCAQVQLHGFADRASRADVDVVVSPGVTPAGPLVVRVREALAAAGLRARDPEHPGCADLAGRRNVQGRAALLHDAPFLHLELSRSVRADPASRAVVAGAVAAASGVQAMAPRLH